MKHSLLASGLLVLLLVAAACGGSREALLTPAERATYASTNTIALAPLNLVARERPEALTAASSYVEQLLTERLERAGFRVLDPAIARPVYDTLALNTQNKYDAGTGEPNPEVMDGLKAAFAREMAERHGADAVLFPEVYVVRANIRSNTANWDRVQEPVSDRLLNETGGSESNVSAALAALSLAVEVVTKEGETLYEERAGLEYVGPLKQRQATPVLFRGQVEKEGVLQGRNRIERAVLLDLDLLAQKKAAAGIAEEGR